MEDFIDEEFAKYVEETEHLIPKDELRISRYFYSESTGFYVSVDWNQICWIEEENKCKTLIMKELKNYTLDIFICSCIVEDARKAKNLELLSNFDKAVDELNLIPVYLK